MSLDVTHARSQLADDSRHEGDSIRFLYAKSMYTFGTNFQLMGYRYSTQGFYTLDDVAYRRMEGYEYDYDYDGEHRDEPIIVNYHNLRFSRKDRLQLNISQSLNDFGSLYISGTHQNTGILRIQIPGIRWGIPAAGLASVIHSHFRGMNL